MSTSALPKQYDPSEVEPKWLSFWLDNGFFHADEASPTVPYSITLPPPNVTGSLHIGHALGSTMQDILIRWRRMQGFNAMWMPGIDHASIAVHVLIEKDLKRKESKSTSKTKSKEARQTLLPPAPKARILRLSPWIDLPPASKSANTATPFRWR